MLAIRLVLVVVGAVCCCCNTQLSYIYVNLLHTQIWAALYILQLIQKKTDLIFTSVTYYSR